MTPSTASTWVFSLLALLGIGLVAGCGSSQPVIGRDVERRVYLLPNQNVDQPPEIVGGYGTLEEMKSYPNAAAQDGAYGVIWLQCTISASGTATRIHLARGGHPALETEALNVVQRLDFRPATKNGAPIQARVQIPVIFQGPYARPSPRNQNQG